MEVVNMVVRVRVPTYQYRTVRVGTVNGVSSARVAIWRIKGHKSPTFPPFLPYIVPPPLLLFLLLILFPKRRVLSPQRKEGRREEREVDSLFAHLIRITSKNISFWTTVGACALTTTIVLEKYVPFWVAKAFLASFAHVETVESFLLRFKVPFPFFWPICRIRDPMERKRREGEKKVSIPFLLLSPSSE